MRKVFIAAAFCFFVGGSAVAQPVGEGSGGVSRQKATLVPPDWAPDGVRDEIAHEAAGRKYVVRVFHIGDQDIYEADFGDARVRMAEDGRVVGRDTLRAR
jgi:hypothetical protein